MGVIAYKKEVSPDVVKTFYLVIAEAINKYTGKRVQKKRRGIPSEPKAERVYRELWCACREERPDGVNFTHWGTLTSRFLESAESKKRSEQNPYGLSPHVVKNKKSLLKHVESWSNTHIDL